MNFKNIVIIFGMLLFMVSCKSSKPATSSKTTNTKSVSRSSNSRDLDSKFDGSVSSDIKRLLKDAEKYMGTPYKYGGTSSSGFDCSGFTLTVFEENNYKLPRRSADQALTGDRVSISKVKPGDLLFFATSGGSKVTHVGIVHDISADGEVHFIHASTSKGVIISSLNKSYWNKAFLHAQRIL